MPGSILVIGAAHIDVHTYYRHKVGRQKDKPGIVKFSIGGTAYNIAANLAWHNKKVSLLTTVNKDTIIGACTEAQIKEQNIIGMFLPSPHRSADAAYVAHYEEQELASAVTYEPIEKADVISYSKLDDEIKEAAVTVVDCNIGADQLTSIVKRCNLLKRPIMIAGVSESKARKVLRIDPTCEMDVFVINQVEALNTFRGIDSLRSILEFLKGVNGAESRQLQIYPGNGSIKECCSLCKARFVIITLGSRGYVVLSNSGDLREMEPIKLDDIPSIYTNGAGDALVAAVAEYFSEPNTRCASPDWGACHERFVTPYVDKVLNIPESAPSRSRPNDLLLSLGYLLDERRKRKSTKGYKLFALLFIIAFALIFIWDYVHSPDKKLDFVHLSFIGLLLLAVLLVTGHISEETYQRLMPSWKPSGKPD